MQKSENMAYNKFYFSIIIRVILLSVTNFLFIFFILDKFRLFTIIFFGILLIGQILLLIRYLNRTNIELTKFLLYLNEQNTSTIYTNKNIEKTFKGLRQSFEKIKNDIRNIRESSEANEIYYKTLINHFGTGIITFGDNGKVEIFNKAAQEILNKENLRNISQLAEIENSFGEFIIHLKPGEQKIFSLQTYNGPVRSNTILQLLVHSTNIIQEGKKKSIVSLQNIGNELDRKELEAWQKLIRVLTHEISNSLTSIATLTSTIRRYLSSGGNTKSIDIIDQEILNSAVNCTKIIEDRSDSLINFINYYKSISKLPKPKKEIISIQEFFNNIERLFTIEFQNKKIEFIKIVIPESLELSADKDLMEQVLINLVNNSIHALNGSRNPRIILRATESESGKLIIRLEDNGHGIAPEIIESIFIPFFTTKDKGSGIGLSLSRHILILHSGTIDVKSQKGKGTIVKLIL